MITRIVSKNFDIPNSHKLEVALANGRYSSIDKLFSMTPDEVSFIIDTVTASNGAKPLWALVGFFTVLAERKDDLNVTD